MTAPAELQAPHPLDEEALFPEAKRRERRRRLFVMLVVVVVLGGLVLGLLAGGITNKKRGGAAQQASGSRPSSGSAANPACRTSSPAFEKALASAIRELRPPVHGAIPYVCAAATRNVALGVEDAGQMGPEFGGEHIVAVALTLHDVVADEGYTGPAGSHAPQGNYVTFNFNAATGALTDFGLRLLSAKHRASDFGQLGAITTGTVVLH